MPSLVSNPVFLTILDPVDPNILRVIKQSAPKVFEEILQPFQVAPGGYIAATSDAYQRAKQHVMALLMVAPGERVMRPTYGLGLQNEVFEVTNPGAINSLSKRAQDIVANNEPGVYIQQLNVQRDPQDDGRINITVSFRIDAAPTIHQFTFDFAGNPLEN